jgi:hypothetical protein
MCSCWILRQFSDIIENDDGSLTFHETSRIYAVFSGQFKFLLRLSHRKAETNTKPLIPTFEPTLPKIHFSENRFLQDRKTHELVKTVILFGTKATNSQAEFYDRRDM